MVKTLLLFCCLSFGLYAQTLVEKASSFVSKDKLDTSSSLISYLFSNEGKYYNGSGNINVVAVLKTLMDNSLLELSFKQPQDLEIAFETKQNPIIFMRSITETLNSMGYNFFLTKNIVKTPEKFVWRISLSTQNIPNPVVLNESLKNHGCDVIDVEKSGNNWSYTINSDNAQIDTIEVKKNRETDLKKPFEPYLIGLSEDIRAIVIKAHPADHWYPRVSFYDKNLHSLSVSDFDKRYSSLKLKTPQDAAYVKIGDKYTLDNIKRGLIITLE